MDLLIGSRDDSTRRRIGNTFRLLVRRLVTTGRGGRMLVHALDEEYDLVIIDGAGLDGLSGTEAVQVLRQIRPRLPVLYMSLSDEKPGAGDAMVSLVSRGAPERVLLEMAEAAARQLGERKQTHGAEGGDDG